MSTSTLIELLELFLSIILLTWFFNGPWQSLLVDMTRQRLFEARDKLFLYAADGRISFDSPIYNEIRNYFNNSIRQCHRFSLTSLIASIFSNNEKVTRTTDSISIMNIISEIEDADLRSKIEELLFESVGFISLLMLLRSILLLPLFMILSPIIFLNILLKGHFKHYQTKMAIIIERDVRMGDA